MFATNTVDCNVARSIQRMLIISLGVFRFLLAMLRDLQPWNVNAADTELRVPTVFFRGVRLEPDAGARVNKVGSG